MTDGHRNDGYTLIFETTSVYVNRKFKAKSTGLEVNIFLHRLRSPCPSERRVNTLVFYIIKKLCPCIRPCVVLLFRHSDWLICSRSNSGLADFFAAEFLIGWSQRYITYLIENMWSQKYNESIVGKRFGLIWKYREEVVPQDTFETIFQPLFT